MWSMFMFFFGAMWMLAMILGLAMCRVAGDADRQTKMWLEEMRSRGEIR